MQSPHLTGNAFGTVSNRFGLNLVPQNYRQGFEPRSPVLDIKGKGKIKETDFDEACAQVVSSLETALANVEPTSGSVDSVEELEKDLNQAMLDDVQVFTAEEVMRDVEFKRFVAANRSTVTQRHIYCSVWYQMQNSDLPPHTEEFAKWEAEFHQLMNAHREEGEWDFSAAMQRTWEEGSASLDVKIDNEGFPILDPYVFGSFYLPHNFPFLPYSLNTEETNKYLDPSSSTLSPLALAKQMLEQNTSLSQFALLLEAAIKKGELGEGCYEAWILLGETRYMDEREEGRNESVNGGCTFGRRSRCRWRRDACMLLTQLFNWRSTDGAR